MTQTFIQAYKLIEVSPKDGSSVVNFKIQVNLTLGDSATFRGYVSHTSGAVHMYITDTGTVSIEDLTVCSAWLAVHKERIVEDIMDYIGLGS